MHNNKSVGLHFWQNMLHFSCFERKKSLIQFFYRNLRANRIGAWYVHQRPWNNRNLWSAERRICSQFTNFDSFQMVAWRFGQNGQLCHSYGQLDHTRQLQKCFTKLRLIDWSSFLILFDLYQRLIFFRIVKKSLSEV